MWTEVRLSHSFPSENPQVPSCELGSSCKQQGKKQPFCNRPDLKGPRPVFIPLVWAGTAAASFFLGQGGARRREEARTLGGAGPVQKRLGCLRKETVVTKLTVRFFILNLQNRELSNEIQFGK